MKKYILKIKQIGWPPELPIQDGQHSKDYDIIESEIPEEWVEWYKKLRLERRNMYKIKHSATPAMMEEVDSKPIGFNESDIPSYAEIIAA